MTQLRIGVIGVTGRGGIAQHWHRPQGRAAVVAGADVSQEALDAFRANLNRDAYVTLDYRELLAGSDVEAVAITSPDFTHEEYVCAAFSAGKHVFCEKPMAITTEGYDRMLRAWKTSGKQFMIGFNMRYMSIFRVMVLEGKEPLATPLAGRMSVAVGVAGTHSIRHGNAPVDVAPPPI